MSEPSLAAQVLINARLKADAGVSALVPAGHIVDRGGLPPIFPCIVIGEAQTVGDDLDCAELSEVSATVHVWTREVGLVECKRIAGAIRRAMRDAEDELEGYALSATFEDSVFLRDPDGRSAHGVLRFAVLAEATS